MKTTRTLSYIIIFLFGIIIGFTVINYRIVSFDTHIPVADAANVLATLLIGVIIPIVASKWLETNKNLKTSLIEECKDTLTVIKRIKDKIEFCFNRGTIHPTDKSEIILLFSEADMSVFNLEDSLKCAFNVSSSTLLQKIRNEYVNYWMTVTGGQLMSASYILIDDAYYRSQIAAWSAFEHTIKIAILDIHKL